MKKLLLLAISLMLALAVHAQDMFPLFRKCNTFPESCQSFQTEFLKAYNYQMKDFKKTDKDGFNRFIDEFKNVQVVFNINHNGKLVIDREWAESRIHPKQQQIINLALHSTPAWSAWEHPSLPKLNVRITLNHTWHKR